MELLWAIEGIRTPFLDLLFSWITRLGEQELLIFVFCLLFWCLNKRMAHGLGLSFFLSGLAVQGMKIIFQVPRPWVVDRSFTVVKSAEYAATGFAFPSGHTQVAASLLGTIAAYVRQIPIKVLCLIFILLVAFSRMYLGVHYLSDVLVSVILTLALVHIAVKYIAIDRINKKRELTIALCLTAFAVVVITIGLGLYFTGRINAPPGEHAYPMVKDLMKAAGATIGFAFGMYFERVHINFSVRCKNLFWHIIKFLIGFIMVFVCMEGLKPVYAMLPIDELIQDALRYFVLVIWITALYPLIIRRFFAVR